MSEQLLKTEARRAKAREQERRCRQRARAGKGLDMGAFRRCGP
jgi:hypothetical protein